MKFQDYTTLQKVVQQLEQQDGVINNLISASPASVFLSEQERVRLTSASQKLTEVITELVQFYVTG